MRLGLLKRLLNNIEGHCIYFEKICGNRIADNIAYRVIKDEQWHYVCRPLNTMMSNNVVNVSKIFLPKGMTHGWVLMNPGWAYIYCMNTSIWEMDDKYDYGDVLYYVHSWLNAPSCYLNPQSWFYKEPVLKRGWWKDRKASTV